MAKSESYQDYLIGSLKDPEEAVGYLNAALTSGDVNSFLVALHHVVQAQGGVAKLAGKSNKSRSSLYKTLSKKGNPYLKNTNDILNAMDLCLMVVKGKRKNNNRRN